MKITSLENDVTTHNAGVDELNREHNIQMEALRTDKAVLEVGYTIKLFIKVLQFILKHYD